MSVKRPHSNGSRGSAHPPCPDLYIYYLKGCVAPGTIPACDRFLGNWEEDGFSFLFFSGPARDRVDALTAAQPRLELLDRFHMSYAEWLGEEPRVFEAGGFHLVPPWLAAEHAHLHPRILLDPGLVFGTGTHPTTRDCLEALQSLFRHCRPTVTIDLGTGTGVLALAAAALGSRRTVALDLNALAVETALRNIRRNRMQQHILAVRSRAEYGITLPAELVIANIHHEVMIEVVSSEGFLQKRWFVLSGLLTGQARDIGDRLADMPVRLRQRWSADGIWHTLMGEIL